MGRILLLIFALLFCSAETLYADYTILLRNGRRITVKGYREEGEKVMVYGLGGEFGIARDQIRSIRRVEDGAELGLVVPKVGGARGAGVGVSPSPTAKAKGKEKDKTIGAEEKGLTPQEKLERERAKEEKEYQQRVRDITQKIRAAEDRYALATRGSKGPEPGLLQSRRAIDARTADLMSRLKDAQHNPAPPTPLVGPPSTTAFSHRRSIPPRAGVRLRAYGAKERELSDLRHRINQLRRERERLIQEMKAKNFETGSLFLD